MHEWGLVADAIGELNTRPGGMPLSKVTLRLGPRTDTATVRAAWEQLTAQTILGASELVLEHQDDLLRCLDCAHDFRGQLPDRCPDCGGDALVIDRTADVTLGAQQTARTRNGRPAEAAPADGTS